MGRSAWIVIVGVGLLVGGCNVFDVSKSEPRTVDALLTDAQSALTAGNTARAVQLLERAFDKDSTDVRVRIELGNALYADRDIDVFTLRAAAEHLVDPAKSVSRFTSAPSSPADDSVCTDGARPEASSGRFAAVPLDAEPLLRLVEHTPVIQRVRRLVVTGVLARRTEAFSEAGVRIRRKGLLVGAVTAVAEAGIGVHDVFDVTDSALFLDREAQSGRALLACADTDRLLTEDHEALCGLRTAATRAVQWLQDRNRLSGSDQTAVLIDRLDTIVDLVVARIECSG